MIRLIAFLTLIALLALGASWIVEQRGSVTLTWNDWRVDTSLPVVAFAISALMVVVLIAWRVASGLLHLPARLRERHHRRRKAQGHHALTQGLVAIGTGDALLARKHADRARRLAPHEPLALLLDAQAAQLAGDRAQARRAFDAMAAREDMRLLGLRGLFIEAQRNDDALNAVAAAEEALKIAPSSSWASHAVLGFRCASGDWAGALAILESNYRTGLIDKHDHHRQRAVLLTAQAMDLADNDAERERRNAMVFEAVKLAPTLVPAAVMASRIYAQDHQVRKAMKVIEPAWRAHPHPDLADAYAHVRLGDSAIERLSRLETLAAKAPAHIEGALAVARAAMDAQEFAKARAALAPFIADPTQRVALLMAEIERGEHGDTGLAREWTRRAVRARHDAVWTADGYVSDRWRPVSPVSGALDAFRWMTPVAALPGAEPAITLETPPDVASSLASLPSASLPPVRESASGAATGNFDPAGSGALDADPVESRADGPAGASGEPHSSQASSAAGLGPVTTESPPPPAPPPLFRSRPAPDAAAQAKRVAIPPVIPTIRPPDDPGVDDDGADLLAADDGQSGQPGGWRGAISRWVG